MKLGLDGDGGGGADCAGKAYPLSSYGGVGWSCGVPLVNGESGCLCFCFCEKKRGGEVRDCRRGRFGRHEGGLLLKSIILHA